MPNFDLREWSDTWAIRFKRDPEKFFKVVKDLNIPEMSIKDLAKALEIPEERADYMQRGFNRKGRPRGTGQEGKPPTLTNTNLRVLQRIQTEYQKLLEKETQLEAELEQLRQEKEKDKYKMFHSAVKLLEGVAKKDKEDVQSP